MSTKNNSREVGDHFVCSLEWRGHALPPVLGTQCKVTTLVPTGPGTSYASIAIRSFGYICEVEVISKREFTEEGDGADTMLSLSPTLITHELAFDK